MTSIVAQRSDAEYIAPIPDRFPIYVKKVVHIPQVLFSYDHIEYPSRDIRHPQRMLETGMRSAGVDHEGGCKLVNVPEPLNRWGVDKLPFASSQSDESVNGIANLMMFFRHIVSAVWKPAAKMIQMIHELSKWLNVKRR